MKRTLLMTVSVVALAFATPAMAAGPQPNQNDATINQVGSGNTGQADQAGGNNYSDIEQLSDGNVAYTGQNGTLGAANDSGITQYGSVGFNTANVYQGGNNNINTSGVTQEWGYYDKATIRQGLDGGSFTTNNSTVLQAGTGNIATVNQN